MAHTARVAARKASKDVSGLVLELEAWTHQRTMGAYAEGRLALVADFDSAFCNWETYMITT